MSPSLVSVIVPVYNSELFLKRSIDSLLAQSYPKIEIVLVNDGSTDGSLNICEAYLRQYPDRIKLLNQKNSGASIARLNGIKASQGHYLMFADSDDYVSTDYVSALFQAVKDNGGEVAVCPMKVLEPGESYKPANTFSSRKIEKDELFTRFFRYEFWGFCGGIYRRDLLESAIFPQATVNEDYYVKAQIFTRAKCVGYVDESLYCYERHPGSLSQQKISERALGEFDNALATWHYIRKNSPEYDRHALAIASEAASKWLGAILLSKKAGNPFPEYEQRIRRFLKQNLLKILTNPHLLWKVKVVMLWKLMR